MRTSDLSKCKCSECPLAKDGRPLHKPVPGHGPDSPAIVIVGESPGKDEIFEGKPFVGPTGQVVEQLIESGLLLKKTDVYLTNATLCTPLDGDKKGMSRAIEACRPRLLEEAALASSLVLSLGSFAVKSLMDTKLGITQLEGALYTLPSGKRLLPTFHPAAALRGREDYFDNISEAFERAKLLLDGHEPESLAVSKFPINWYAPQDARLGLLRLQAKVMQRGHMRVAIDLETRSLRFLVDPILQIGFFDGEEVYIFEYGGRVRKPNGEWADSDLPGWDQEAKDLFKTLLRNDLIEWVLHNQKFDFQFLRHNIGEVPERSIDTMCLALGMTEQQSRVGLDVLARRWFNAQPYWDEIEQWLPKSKAKRMYDLIPRETLGKYLAHDVVYTWHLVEPLQRECVPEGTLSVTEMLMRYQRLFSKWETRGVKLDREYVRELRKIWVPVVQEALKELQNEAAKVGFDARKVVKAKKAQRELNPGSPKQLKHLFYDLMKLRPIYNKLRKLTTDKEFIKTHDSNAVVKKLQEYRTMQGMLSKYIDGVDKYLWPDGRIHPDILVFGTVTGRLAIKRPPLQTIPKEKRLKIKFDSLRKLFTTDWPDWVIVEADYSQLEMRILWHYTQDPLLGEALAHQDFHKFMASKYFKVPIDKVTDKQRDDSKFITFGIVYGRQAYSISLTLGCSVPEAQALIDYMFKLMPKAHEWWKRQQQLALSQQFVTTTLGRKRRWPLITPRNVQEVRNQSVNAPIQSLASDLNTLAAERLEEELWAQREWGRPLFVVHDAIMFEVKRQHLDESCKLIREVMCDPPFETCAKFDVDISWGRSWGELQKYKGPHA